MTDNTTEVRKIADFLDLPVQEEVIAAIVADTSYGAVKQRAEALGQSGEALIRAGRSAYDPESLLHVGHAPLGADRDWTQQLSSEQKAYALQQLSDWIDADGRWHPDSRFNRTHHDRKRSKRNNCWSCSPTGPSASIIDIHDRPNVA